MSNSASLQDPVSKLVFEMSKLPGIGDKTATRLAYFILKQDVSYAQSLAQSITNAKQKIHLCEQCLTFTDLTPCRICSNARRDKKMICVVERPTDVFSIENSGTYHGIYHVLHGALSPLDGIGPEQLKIRELIARIQPDSQVGEVILANNPTVEGDATALYLSKMIQPLGIRVSKLAHGIPVGGQLEYTDRQTIGKAIENRVELQS